MAAEPLPPLPPASSGARPISPNAQVVTTGLWVEGVPAVRVKRRSDRTEWIVREGDVLQARPANRLATGEYVEVLYFSEPYVEELELTELEVEEVPASFLAKAIEAVRDDEPAAPIWPAKPPLPEQTTGLIEKVTVPREEYMRLLDDSRRLKNLLTAIKQVAGPAL